MPDAVGNIGGDQCVFQQTFSIVLRIELEEVVIVKLLSLIGIEDLQKLRIKNGPNLGL